MQAKDFVQDKWYAMRSRYDVSPALLVSTERFTRGDKALTRTPKKKLHVGRYTWIETTGYLILTVGEQYGSEPSRQRVTDVNRWALEGGERPPCMKDAEKVAAMLRETTSFDQKTIEDIEQSWNVRIVVAQPRDLFGPLVETVREEARQRQEASDQYAAQRKRENEQEEAWNAVVSRARALGITETLRRGGNYLKDTTRIEMSLDTLSALLSEIERARGGQS